MYAIRSYYELAATYFAMLDELGHYLFGHVDRNGETDTDVTTALRQDGGVNAHQFAAQVDQRAT